jgi:CBS domain-containing protein
VQHFRSTKHGAAFRDTRGGRPSLTKDRSMLCKQIMKHDVACVFLDDSAQTAAVRMLDDNVGFLPVCDAEGRVVGTLTDRDLALRVVAKDLPSSTPVTEIMTHEVIACSPSDDVHRAEQLMGKYKKSRIICANEEGHPVGVISLSDIAQYETSEQTARTMRRVTQREVNP